MITISIVLIIIIIIIIIISIINISSSSSSSVINIISIIIICFLGRKRGQSSQSRPAIFQVEGLESRNHCSFSLQKCPLKVQTSQGLGTFFQIEFLKTGRANVQAETP